LPRLPRPGSRLRSARTMALAVGCLPRDRRRQRDAARFSRDTLGDRRRRRRDRAFNTSVGMPSFVVTIEGLIENPTRPGECLTRVQSRPGVDRGGTGRAPREAIVSARRLLLLAAGLQDLVHGPVADLLAVMGSDDDRVTEVVSDVDAGHRVLSCGLGEASGHDRKFVPGFCRVQAAPRCAKSSQWSVGEQVTRPASLLRLAMHPPVLRHTPEQLTVVTTSEIAHGRRSVCARLTCRQRETADREAHLVGVEEPLQDLRTDSAFDSVSRVVVRDGWGWQ
jgi:hypothetical protein